MRFFLFAFLACAAGLHAADPDPAVWKPAASPLFTRWAKDVSPDHVLPEYPRPQMVRPHWSNLNGLWDYAVTPKDAAAPPAAFDGKILVPFPIEAPLSGVKRALKPDERLWYRRTFDAPALPDHGRLLLHFGAVDWQAVVSVNGKPVGEHKGGYDPFTFDITNALKPSGSPQEIVVSVYDPTDTGDQPLGKQVLQPKGIRYTATSGIWQTVWLEAVPGTYISGLKIVPDVDHHTLRLTAQVTGEAATDVTVTAIAYEHTPEQDAIHKYQPLAMADAAPGKEMELSLDHPRLWTPDSPYLYGIMVWIKHAPALPTLDQVDGYFAMRKIERTGDAAHPGYALNGKPIFMMGVLDQGFWPDGNYTAPTDDALRYDIEATKQLGFNASRKHVKIEPDRWYYWADKLGLLVWQDAPFAHNKTPEGRAEFETDLKTMVDDLGNHPSIVQWVLFNEKGGQYDTERLTGELKKWDPTRLVDAASGWDDKPVGDVIDVHHYPKPGPAPAKTDRIPVVGEFGGLYVPTEGHDWPGHPFNYEKAQTPEEFTNKYVGLLDQVRALRDHDGLAGAIYTQLTDVEIECSGLMTYDRAVIHSDVARTAAANRAVQTAP